MTKGDFFDRGQKDRLSGKTFRYMSSVISNQRDQLRELNYVYVKLKAKHDILQMDFDDLLDDNDLSGLIDDKPTLDGG